MGTLLERSKFESASGARGRLLEYKRYRLADEALALGP